MMYKQHNYVLCTECKVIVMTGAGISTGERIALYWSIVLVAVYCLYTCIVVLYICTSTVYTYICGWHIP